MKRLIALLVEITPAYVLVESYSNGKVARSSIMARYRRSRLTPVVLLGVSCVAAQLQYGENQRGTIKDSEVVSRAFPDVNGIELLSPAFLNPDSTPEGWVNGTDGPTDDTEMGIQ